MNHLPQVAHHTVPAAFTVETVDYEDHSFSGIMFDLQVKPLLHVPVLFIEIHSFWVRGDLGPVSIYVTSGGYGGHGNPKHVDSSEWKLVFQDNLPPCWNQLCQLELEIPVRVACDDTVGIYLHSELPNDQAIVYGEKHAHVTHEDVFMRILPGIGHVSNQAFRQHNAWGWAWRDPRQFVGNVTYGIKYLLWSPKQHQRFPESFRNCAFAVVGTHKYSPILCRLPKDIILHILNMCSYDWFGELQAQESDIDVEATTEFEMDEIYHFNELRRRFAPESLEFLLILRQLARHERAIAQMMPDEMKEDSEDSDTSFNEVYEEDNGNKEDY